MKTSGVGRAGCFQELSPIPYLADLDGRGDNTDNTPESRMVTIRYQKPMTIWTNRG